ncbi:twin-arginine translocation signal domain-containing protein [Acetobacter persici]|uniref:twin-arginine translocation signal domain-containing protein n=1 Tax=Acetobacter persici TaxID=1076596 RepID=UPI0039EC8CB3
MIQSRRNFLRTSGLVVAAGALAACTVTTNGKTTTLTLNTAKVKAYGQAGINAVTTILSVTSIATAMGTPAVAAIEAAGVTLSASLTAFASETNGSLTVSYDNTSAKTRVDTLLVDLNAAAVALRAGLAAAQQTVTNGVINTAITTFNALLTVIDAFEGMLGISLTSVTTTQEATALSTLAVK